VLGGGGGLVRKCW